MKLFIKELIALVLILTFLLTFAACGKAVSLNTTVRAKTTAETAAETTLETSTSGSSTLPAVNTTAAVTEPVQNTTASTIGTSAPVGTDIAKIVAFYNRYANLTKAYAGTVTVAKMTGSISNINYIAAGKSIAEKLLPNTYGAKPDLTFVNGISGSTKLVDYLPRKGEAKMSVLEPAGVKSAACAVSGAGFEISITLKAETITGPTAYKDRPKYHYECMDTMDLLNFSPADFKPFTFKTATVIYTDATTIHAVINSKGVLDNLHIFEPSRVIVDLTWGFIKLKNTDITGIFKEDYIFTYIS